MFLRCAPYDALDHGDSEEHEMMLAGIRKSSASENREAVRDGNTEDGSAATETDGFVSKRSDSLDPDQNDHGTGSAQR